MMLNLEKSLVVLTSWPVDVYQSIDYHLHRLSAVGSYAESIDVLTENLPPADVFHRALSSESAVSNRGLYEIWSSHNVMSDWSHICSNIGRILYLSGLSRNKADPVLRRSVMALADRLIPPSSRDLSLHERVREPIEIATARHHGMTNGAPGYWQNLNMLMMLTGLENVASHPALSNHDFRGPTPARRHAGRDTLSLLCFTVVAGFLPAWIRAQLSPKEGAASSFLGIALGSVVHYWSSRRAQNAPRPLPQKRDDTSAYGSLACDSQFRNKGSSRSNEVAPKELHSLGALSC